MTRWTFFGRILPERFPLKLSEPLSFTSEGSLDRYQATIYIADGQFVAQVVLESGPDDVLTLRNSVESDIRTITDYVGYLQGISFDIDMISATCDDGRTVVFGIAIPAIQANRTNQTHSFDLQRYSTFAADGPARIALADFREAMRNPVGTGFYCYRAVEAMMQSMKNGPTDKNPQAWDALRERLQIDRSAIDAIQAHANDSRHGKPSSISDAERAMVFQLTDKIIGRYLEYLERGKTPLPTSEFPLFRKS